nr:uncharacterized protein LOC127321353 [Lolium perenne]
MMTPQEQAEMIAYFAELDAREAKMTPKDKAECNAYFKHLESRSDTPHESSEDVSISNNLTSTPLVLSSSLLGCSDIDDAIDMEMRDSTICEMSDSTICEMSDSTICELDECLHFKSMSDTPSEMRVVVDRSCEAISNSNNLPSTSSVFPCVLLGPMDDETPIMEKMYMVHEDDDITPCLLLEDEHGGHIEPTTSTTPTSYERDYKGTQNPMSTSIEHELTKRALESMIQVSSNEWFRPHTSTTQDLSMRAQRHFDKVTSFNLRSLAIPMELRLLFECCVACLVLLIGFMISDATFKSCCHLPPLPVHDELSSRATLFQVGGDDVARP